MSNRAWVTLATNDSYGLGALVLAHSLRRAGSLYSAVVLITPSVTDAMRERLRAVFAEVVMVDVLDSKDAAHLALLQRPELGITFTKIHCWSLTQFEKCVFLDADTLIIQNCDELFEREELSAAPDVGWPDCFNSGVFVYKPSKETFEQLIKFAQERGSFDGGDQGLLNSFFSDWAHGDINKHLPFLYNVTSAAFYSYLPALKHYGQDLKIIHFIGIAKPWLQQFNWESRTVEAPEHIKGLLQLWWDLFVSQVHPQLDVTMSGVAGNLARVVPGALGSQREALDELTRRQGWEAGNIDYMGADSFDNIWAKISQTLGQTRVSPPKQPSPPKEEPKQEAPAPAPVEVAQEAVTVDAAVPQVPAPAAEAPAEAQAPGEAPAAVEAPAKIEAAPVAVPEAAAAVEAPAVVETAAKIEASPVEAAPAVEAPAAEAAAQPEPVAPADIPATVEAAAAPAPEAEPLPVESSEIPATVEAIAPGETPKSADVPVTVEAAAAPEVAKDEPKTETPALPPTPPVTPKSTPESTPVSESAPTLEPVEVQKDSAPAAPAEAPVAPAEAPAVPVEAPVAPVEAPAALAVAPAAPVEAPAVPVEAPAASSEAPAVPVEAPAAPVDVTAAPEVPAPVEAPVAPTPVEAAKVTPVVASEAPAPAEAPKDPVEVKKEEIPVPVEAAKDPAPAVETQKEAPAPVEAPKDPEPAAATPASPAPVAEAPASPEASAAKPESTPKKPSEAPSLSASTDSPPLANTPSKEEPPALPTAKSEERRKAVGKLQLSPPAVADPLPTPDSELEDAAALAQSIIASELSTPTVTEASPVPQAEPAPPAQDKRLAVEEPQVPTPPVGAVSLEQIGVKAAPKSKPTTAAQIESSVSDKSAPASPTDAPKDAPKKKVIKKVKKESAATGGAGADAPVPPPRKKEKKPKEK